MNLHQPRDASTDYGTDPPDNSQLILARGTDPPAARYWKEEVVPPSQRRRLMKPYILATVLLLWCIFCLASSSQMKQIIWSEQVFYTTSKVAERHDNKSSKETGCIGDYEFPINVTSFRQLENIDLKVPLPKQLNIVIVGDSVTKYFYISLTYFLKFGSWINMKHPLPVAKNESISNMYKQESTREAVPHLYLIWKNFFESKESHTESFDAIMGHLDICDCVGSNAVQWDKKYGVNDVWNRYFRQNSKNNSHSVTFFQKYGDNNNWRVPIEFKSTWGLQEINKLVHNEESMRKNSNNGTQYYNQSSEVKYATSNWTEFILNFVAKMEPKPNSFVFNQGLWPHPDFERPEVYKSIIAAISNAGMLSIYKTTTKRSDTNDTRLDPYEQEICNLVDHCLDLSWTAHLPEYMYVDQAHFVEPVYSWMNIQMLDILFGSSCNL